MSKLVELIQHGGKGKPRIWRIWVEGDRVFTEYGSQGGKMVPTEDVPGSKGKKGTKAYISPEEQAALVMERKVKRQRARGYVGLDEEPVSDIEWDGPLPSSLRFAKPINNAPKGFLEENAEKILWTPKKNGMCHLVTRIGPRIYIQTRDKMHDVGDWFPHLKREFFDVMPSMSIVMAEIVVGRGRTKKDFLAMGSISRSKAERAQLIQRDNGGVNAYIFRVPFWRGVHLEADVSCAGLLEHMAKLPETEHISAAPVFQGNYKEVCKELLKRRYEGFVGYLAKGVYGDESYNFKGREDRPKVAWKLRLSQVQGGRATEDDFVACWNPAGKGMHCSSSCHYPSTGDQSESESLGRCGVCKKKLVPDGTWGTGRYMEKVGSLSLYQYDEEGVSQYIGDVSSGLTAADKTKLADPELYPLCVRVSYKDRDYVTDGGRSNALAHPTFEGVRKDKEWTECVNPDL